jgi:acyl-CoA synthetase (AMP-forming)/AMP-acid ligase II
MTTQSLLDFSTQQGSPVTLVSQLDKHAQERPYAVAVTFLENGEDVESTISYGELRRSAIVIAGALRERAQPGARIVLGYPNGIDFLRAFFACQYAGMIPVPVAPPRVRGRAGDLDRMENILRNVDPALLLTSEKARAKACHCAGPIRSNRQWTTLEELGTAGPPFEMVAPTADTIAFLQYTSGSTTDPRGVVVTHRNLVANIRAIGEGMSVDDSSRILSWLPLFHDMGLIGAALNALLRGLPLVLMSPTHFIQRPLRWLRAMSRYRATLSGAPNFAYELCVQRSTEAERAGLDLSCWRTAFNGAEPVRRSTLEAFASTFGRCGLSREALFPCYGLAESTLYVSGARLDGNRSYLAVDAEALALGRAEPPREHAVHLVSCGVSPSGHRLRIVEPQSGNPVPEGIVGEIWVAGPSVTSGYWNSHEAASSTFGGDIDGDQGMYLRTGDLGFIRAGQLYVTGRLKDLLIVRGRNLYPQDLEATVESCCEALPDGNGAAFLDDKEGAGRLVVVHELRNSCGLELTDLMQQIAERLVEVHEVMADRIVLIGAGSLPKTSSGKVRRSATREALRAGQLPVIAEYRRQISRGEWLGVC